MGYIDLGYENEWKETPQLFEHCWEQQHKIEERELMPNVYEYTCDICKLKWQVDCRK